MTPDASLGTEVLRIESPDGVPGLNDWIHDAYLEDAFRFSPESAQAVIPFAQESGWGHLHPSMADPELVAETMLARHYHVPLTRCYIVVEQAKSLDADIDWGNPSLLEADFSESTLLLRSGSFSKGISVGVTDVDVRVLVSPELAGRLFRKVLRLWPAESDRWLSDLS